MLLSFPICSVTVKADSKNRIDFYGFSLFSPLNGTYNSRFLTVNVSFGAAMGIKYSLYYYIDGKYVDTIPITVNKTGTHVVYPASGFAELPELTEGAHSVTVFFICSGLIRKLPSNNGTVYFTIDSNSPNQFQPQPSVDSTPPSISNISLENGTYLQSKIPLNFTVNEEISYATYSLDGKDNITISKNTTLTGLSIGQHNLTVYAWDAFGNVGNQTVYFTITNGKSTVLQLENSQIILVGAVSAVTIIGFVLGFLFNRRRQRKKCSNQKKGACGF